MSIFRRTAAFLSAALIMLSFAACSGKTDNGDTTTSAVQTTQAQPETTAQEASVSESTAETTAMTKVQTTEPETTEAPTTSAPTTVALTTQAPTTAKPVTATKAPTTTKKPTTTAKPTTTKKAVTAPTSKKDIVNLYNSAAANAAKAKPGYTKSKTTSLNNLKMGALANISVVRETVGNFLGEGSSTETVKKGSFDGKSLVKSSLKESDVTAATCKLSEDKKYYIVSITVKNETNPLKGNSALGRFTNDYKDINEINSGLAEAGASVGSITINTTSVTINAKIGVENNRFASVTHNIKMSAVLKDIKYTFVKVSEATSDLETKVVYSDFKY
ncbi:MAG: hypothetical protein ACI4IX_03245 [Acutalibacteraceae bacterium]